MPQCKCWYYRLPDLDRWLLRNNLEGGTHAKKNDLSVQRHHYFTGKCDWCDDSVAKVYQLYDSELKIEGMVRLAQVCDDCQSEYKL